MPTNKKYKRRKHMSARKKKKAKAIKRKKKLKAKNMRIMKEQKEEDEFEKNNNFNKLLILLENKNVYSDHELVNSLIEYLVKDDSYDDPESTLYSIICCKKCNQAFKYDPDRNNDDRDSYVDAFFSDKCILSMS